MILPAEPVYWRATPHQNRALIAERFQRVTHAQCRVTRRHPTAPDPGSPAGAAALYRRPLPPASNPSCAVCCQTVRREIAPPRPRPLLRKHQTDALLASRNDEAHSVSVPSADAAPIIRSRIMVTHGFRIFNKKQTVMLDQSTRLNRILPVMRTSSGDVQFAVEVWSGLLHSTSRSYCVRAATRHRPSKRATGRP